MEFILILQNNGFLNLLIFLATFTLWGRHFVKSISSTVYSGFF